MWRAPLGGRPPSHIFWRSQAETDRLVAMRVEWARAKAPNQEAKAPPQRRGVGELEGNGGAVEAEVPAPRRRRVGELEGIGGAVEGPLEGPLPRASAGGAVAASATTSASDAPLLALPASASVAADAAATPLSPGTSASVAPDAVQEARATDASSSHEKWVRNVNRRSF